MYTIHVQWSLHAIWTAVEYYTDNKENLNVDRIWDVHVTKQKEDTKIRIPWPSFYFGLVVK